MKILTKFLIFIIMFFSISISIYAKEVPVIKDDGTKPTYRGSSEVIMRDEEYNYPLQQTRAVWASNFIGSISSFSSKEQWMSDWDALLDKFEANRINIVIFHVRTHNNALYNSDLNPIATWFKKVNFKEFDPMEYAITETHKRGMEFHAWMNPYRLNDSYCAEAYPSVNPASNKSNILESSSTYDILDPGLPNVRKFLVDTCIEFLSRYNADAIHFDDYFYVNNIDDTSTRTKYNTDKLSVDDFRRKQVDLFIEQLHNAITKFNKDNSKCVSLGISPSGVYRNASYSNSPKWDASGNLVSPIGSSTAGMQHYQGYLYSDTLNWINHEWIDYIMPQLYWCVDYNAASFASLSRWWSWAVKYKKVNLYTGIGVYMAESGSGGWGKNINEVRDIILNAQMYDEIGGVSFYSDKYLTSTNPILKKGFDLLRNDYYKTFIPADVKKMLSETIDTVKIKLGNTINGVFNWDVDSNDEKFVRGYMVFEVPKGSSLDLSTSKQVAYYGTSKSYKFTNSTSDYYVSSVNLANEISTPVKLRNKEYTASEVIKMIDDLGDYIKMGEETSLDFVKSVYDSLNQTEQKKITNYNKIILLEENIKLRNERIEIATNFLPGVKNEYSNQMRIEINSRINKFLSDIKNITSKEDEDSLYGQLMDDLDNYPTIEEELESAINLAKNDFYAYISLNYYYVDTINNEKIVNLTNSFNEEIEKISFPSSAEKIYFKYIEALNDIETCEELYKTKQKELIEFIDNFYYLNIDLIDKERVLLYKEEVSVIINSLSNTSPIQMVDHTDELKEDIEIRLNELLEQYKFVESHDETSCKNGTIFILINLICTSIFIVLKKKEY